MSNNPALPDALAAIRARRAAIPDGELQIALGPEGSRRIIRDDFMVAELANRFNPDYKVDAEFFVHAPSDIDALLAAIDALLAERVTPPATTAAGVAEPGNAAIPEHVAEFLQADELILSFWYADGDKRPFLGKTWIAAIDNDERTEQSIGGGATIAEAAQKAYENWKIGHAISEQFKQDRDTLLPPTVAS